MCATSPTFAQPRYRLTLSPSRCVPPPLPCPAPRTDTERVYIDSRELALHLRQRFGHARSPRHPAPYGHVQPRAEWEGAEEEGPADPHASLDVPVFVFQLHREVAVMIDKHYNARALEDMVLVITNGARE